MPQWEVDGEPKHDEGGSDSSADVSHGYKFHLRHRESGRTTTTNVEAAGGAKMSEADVRAKLAVHLDQMSLRRGSSLAASRGGLVAVERGSGTRSALGR